MSFGAILPMRTAIADMATHSNQRRAVFHGNGIFDRRGEGVEVVGVFHSLSMPAVSIKAFADIFGGEGKFSTAVDGDVIVVVEIDDIAEAEMAGDRGRLAGHSFHQITVADDGKDPMIEQL